MLQWKSVNQNCEERIFEIKEKPIEYSKATIGQFERFNKLKDWLWIEKYQRILSNTRTWTIR